MPEFIGDDNPMLYALSGEVIFCFPRYDHADDNRPSFLYLENARLLKKYYRPCLGSYQGARILHDGNDLYQNRPEKERPPISRHLIFQK